MNREEAMEVFENRRDSELAEEMFRRFPTITETDISSTGAALPTTVKRGTPIRFVRELAHVHGFLAYVLPGAEPSRNVGCFRPPDTGKPTYPPLILLGKDRTLIDATFRDDNEGPERTRAWSLRISDQRIVSAERSAEDQALLGALPDAAQNAAALRELPPEDNTREDPAPRTDARARSAAFAMRMNAAVVPGCYDAILAPYRTVTLRAGDTAYSGDWLIRKVTHRITPSVYTQEIEAQRNAVSEPGGGLPGIGSVF
jgi:phage protein D